MATSSLKPDNSPPPKPSAIDGVPLSMRMATSDGFYVYLQRPDNHEWVTIGRYSSTQGSGIFEYTDTYLAAGHPWPVDPITMPLGRQRFIASTYSGLHAILRDSCPDAWGKTILQKAHSLSPATPDAAYLAFANNTDRWGALAFGKSKKPVITAGTSTRLADLQDLVSELTAMMQHRPAVNTQLRQRLLQTQSLGGARPKATIQDGASYWLVKPFALMDQENIPLLEHVTHTWGRAVGLNLAKTEIHHLDDGTSVVRVLRFDRFGAQRYMVMSGATLLQIEYPKRFLGSSSRNGSYTQLAQQLSTLGAPREDCQELLGRMLFNYLVGNDDDHPRNHAAIYDAESRRWRLSPGFDVVPNPSEVEIKLSLGITEQASAFTKDAVLSEYKRFGFETIEAANQYIEDFVYRVEQVFNVSIKQAYPPAWQSIIENRLQQQRLAFTGKPPGISLSM